MKDQQDYIQDIAEIRSMMERSSKFLSLSGWAGIMAGIYALAGAYIAYSVFNFNPDEIFYGAERLSSGLTDIIVLGVIVLALALGTAIFLSYRKAVRKGEKIWNAVSKQLLTNMAVPLAAGGILIVALISKGLLGLIAPLTLLFYGISLYNAGRFTYLEVKYLGLVQMGLGMISSYFIEYGLLFWAAGFGVVHIIYGIYIYLRHER